MRRPPIVTSSDLALLRALGELGSVVAASRRARISRDQAVYRLARLGRAFGGPVASGRRGGRAFGGSHLTPLGRRIAERGYDGLEMLGRRPLSRRGPANLVRGTYRGRPGRSLSLSDGTTLTVAFDAVEGATVDAIIDPEAILLARQKFPTSARNRLEGTVERVVRGPSGSSRAVLARTGRQRWRVAVTEETVRSMGLSIGRRVWLYVKATAIRPIAPTPTRGSRRR